MSGIQQVGIGNTDVQATWKWYRQNFGFDVPIFEEAAVAGLMLPYTGGEPQKRHAVLALNLNGGGGLEIWQYTDREVSFPAFKPQPGDLGIYGLKLKTRDVGKCYHMCKAKHLDLVGPVVEEQGVAKHFFLRDLHQNVVQICPSGDWFQEKRDLMGGVLGAILGVSNMERSMKFYADILGFDQIVSDKSGQFDDLDNLADQSNQYHRVLLRRSKPNLGPFSQLLGDAEIELVQVLDRAPRKLYEDRFWGDPGYIHLCFDIVGMAEMKERCESFGHPFTVDSASSFDMGEAAGHFTYIEDPDGTLIEFVETHKIPILKRMNWYLDLRKRRPDKALPEWMLKSLAFNRVKD
ncbi:MAG: VOC family protein [Saprospiraceae bacterium]